MKVLLTGATGFIGGNLALALAQQGYGVRALVRPGSDTRAMDSLDRRGGAGPGRIEKVAGDILDPDSLRRAAAGCQAVFHCAAAYTFWAKDPADIYRVNVDGTVNVLRAAQAAGVDKIVYTSTVSTIPLPRRGLGVEDDPTGQGRLHLTGHYKQSKYQAEQAALAMAAAGLPVVVVNPTAPVGPWDVKPTPTGRIVLDFLRGRMPALLNTGLNLVDVADVAAGHILALEKGLPGQRYLLGHRNLTLREVADMLSALAGRPPPRWQIPFGLALAAAGLDNLIEGKLLGREPRLPLEGLRVARRPMYVSCQKAVQQLGLPQSPVEPALERAVKWFRDYGYG